jgi:hypothetical protein
VCQETFVLRKEGVYTAHLHADEPVTKTWHL